MGVLIIALLCLHLTTTAVAQTIWLSPQAPYPPAGISGALDFMQLFTSDTSWDTAGKRIKVVQLSTQFMAWVPDNQLKVIVEELTRKGIGLGIESLAQNDDTDPRCGQGVEGYGRPKEVKEIAAKIKRVGGTLQYLAMDEPLFFGHYYSGPGACRSDVDNVTDRVAEVLSEYCKVFPDVIIGDIEPAGAFRQINWSADYKLWIDLFRKKVGVPMAFLRLDIDWNDGDPIQALNNGINVAKKNNLKLQIVYNGRDTDDSDDAWILNAKSNIKLIQSHSGNMIDSIIFQSWVRHPTHLLPETEPTTLTGLVVWYINTFNQK